MLGGSLGLNREYSREYSSARLTARLWRRLRWLGLARMWHAWTLVVFFLEACRLRVGYSGRMFRRHVWATSCSDEASFYTSEFLWMKPTLWNDQNVFLTTLKIQIYPKNASVFWRTGFWYQLLVGKTTGGGFETLRGDKTHCFISTTRNLQYLNKNSIHALSFSLVCLSNLSTQNRIHLVVYLYTN